MTARSAALVPAASAPVTLAESPLWDAGRQVLWWADIVGGDVHAYDPCSREDRAYPLGTRLGAIAPCADGTLLVGAGREVVRFDPGSGTRAVVATVPGSATLNDGACDPRGRLLIGTLVDEAVAGTAKLYRVDAGRVDALLDGVTISNGLDWSPDGTTLYYVDTPTERIDAFDYDAETGALGQRRVFADLHGVAGRPDGLTVDADGGVWVAMAKGGAAVRRFEPNGTPDAVIELPVPHATSVAFGGADWRDLWITTSQLRMSAADLAAAPLSGRIFVLPGSDWEGRPAVAYTG